MHLVSTTAPILPLQLYSSDVFRGKTDRVGNEDDREEMRHEGRRSYSHRATPCYRNDRLRIQVITFHEIGRIEFHITFELLSFLFGFINFICVYTVESDVSDLPGEFSVLHETMDPERMGHNVELTPLHHNGTDNPPEDIWDTVHVKSST